jgi:hypothetical protein
VAKRAGFCGAGRSEPMAVEALPHALAETAANIIDRRSYQLTHNVKRQYLLWSAAIFFGTLNRYIVLDILWDVN